MDNELKITNYPVSLIEEVKYLRKVRDNLRETIAHQQTEIDRCRDRLIENYELNNKSEDGEVWRWIGDGYDYTRSMRNSMLVLVSAGQLKELLNNGELLED